MKFEEVENLRIYQQAEIIADQIWQLSSRWGSFARETVGKQLARSADSIGANIAEGCGKSGDREFARFLQISMGSSSELEYHILLAHDLGFLGDSDYEKLESEIVEVKRMLTGLIKTLKATR